MKATIQEYPALFVNVSKIQRFFLEIFFLTH